MYQESAEKDYKQRAGYEISRMKLQNRGVSRSAQDLVVENARAQELNERRTSDLAPGAYMMGSILEKNGEKYRSGNGGQYMTTEDYRSLYTSRRVSHINETAHVYQARRIDRRNVAENDAGGNSTSGPNRMRSTAPGGIVPDRNGSPVQENPIPGVRKSAHSTAPTAIRKASPATVGERQNMGVIRRAGSAMAEWFPMDETYIRRKNKKKFPLAMVMMIIVVSVSLLLIVCGSVMTSHMERRISALNSDLAELRVEAEKIESQLDLKNDPVALEKMALSLGMVKSDYVDMRVLDVSAEEKSVVYETEEKQGMSLSMLLSAMGFLRK